MKKPVSYFIEEAIEEFKNEEAMEKANKKIEKFLCQDYLKKRTQDMIKA